MILTADIGTTNLKTGFVNKDGLLVAFESEHIASDGVSTNPSVWIKAFTSCANRLCVKDKDIDCIIISGNGPTLAPSDSGMALLWTHSAPKQADFIKKHTGLDIGPTMFLPKLLYIKEQMPEVYNSNRFFMSSPEYLSFFLTGKAATVMPLEGLEKWYWNNETLSKLGLDESKLPDFASTGSLLGKVTPYASAVCGIKEGTPVLCGCPDFVAAIVGSGAMDVGQVCDRTGTGDGLNYCSAEREEHPLYMSYRHPNGINWNISYVVPDTGALIDARKPADLSYSEFFRTKNGYETCKDVCDRLKQALDLICKSKPTVMRVIGGPAKSGSFNQLRADITGIPVETVQSPQAGLSGLGIMAISALNHTSISQNAIKMVKVKERYAPRAK